MSEGKGRIISSIILSIALIYGVSAFLNSYNNKSYPQNHTVTASLITDLSKLESAIENQNDDVLSIYETARYLGIKEDYFQELFYEGKLDGLPYVTIGGTVIFSKKSLSKWIEDASKSHMSLGP